MSARERSVAFYAATDEVMNFINSLDTSDMSAKDVRHQIYSFCLGLKPKPYRPLEDDS